MKKARFLYSKSTGCSHEMADFVSTKFRYSTQIVFKTYVL